MVCAHVATSVSRHERFGITPAAPTRMSQAPSRSVTAARVPSTSAVTSAAMACTPAGSTEVVDRFSEEVAVAVDDRHLRPLVAEPADDRTADVAGAARHDGSAALEARAARRPLSDGHRPHHGDRLR